MTLAPFSKRLSEMGQIHDSQSEFSFAAEGVWGMKYRKLGNTGLIVSEVALGTMQFGGKMNMGNLGQEDTTRMVKLALDRGSTSSIRRTCTASVKAKLWWVML
jgi:hypothetical protein